MAAGFIPRNLLFRQSGKDLQKMSKLVIAVLNDQNGLEKFEELDMSWVDSFNKEFENQKVPFKEEIYREELVEMTSYAILSGMVLTENDEEFRVNREPLKTIIRKLFGYESAEPTNTSQEENPLSEA